MKALHVLLEEKKHVIWDWNGTLLNDLTHALNVVNKLLEEEKLPSTTMENYLAEFCFPVVDYYENMGFDVSPANFQRLCVRFNDLFYPGLPTCDLWPGARETLQHIRESGKIQSVLSATEHDLLITSLNLFKVDHLFHHAFGIEGIQATSKVSRGHELMERAGVPAADTVLIGDTSHDLEVGEALGIDVILVEHGHQHPARLREIHRHVVKVF